MLLGIYTLMMEILTIPQSQCNYIGVFNNSL